MDKIAELAKCIEEGMKLNALQKEYFDKSIQLIDSMSEKDVLEAKQLAVDTLNAQGYRRSDLMMNEKNLESPGFFLA